MHGCKRGKVVFEDITRVHLIQKRMKYHKEHLQESVVAANASRVRFVRICKYQPLQLRKPPETLTRMRFTFLLGVLLVAIPVSKAFQGPFGLTRSSRELLQTLTRTESLEAPKGLLAVKTLRNAFTKLSCRFERAYAVRYSLVSCFGCEREFPAFSQGFSLQTLLETTNTRLFRLRCAPRRSVESV